MVRSSADRSVRINLMGRLRAPQAPLRAAILAALWMFASLFPTCGVAVELGIPLPENTLPMGVGVERLPPPDLKSLEPLFDPPPLVASPADTRMAGSCSLWLISSRASGCATDPEALALYHRMPGGEWTRGSLAEFHAEDALGMPTIFFVHGNRYTAEDALETGETIYHGIGTVASAKRPVRFVIWSWPSDKIPRGQIKDLRVKAMRAEWQGIHLARFVAGMDPHVPVGLMGHSFGSRLISSSLHVLGGGTIAGWQLERPLERNAPLRVVLMAAAMGNQWLLPGERHGQAMNSVDGVLVITNSEDGVLRWYPRLFPGPGSDALGYSGIVFPTRLGPNLNKVEQIDAAHWIGKGHNLVDYYRSPLIWQRASSYVLFEP